MPNAEVTSWGHRGMPADCHQPTWAVSRHQDRFGPISRHRSSPFARLLWDTPPVGPSCLRRARKRPVRSPSFRSFFVRRTFEEHRLCRCPETDPSAQTRTQGWRSGPQSVTMPLNAQVCATWRQWPPINSSTR